MVEINWYPLPVSARDRAGLNERCEAAAGGLQPPQLEGQARLHADGRWSVVDCTAREVSGEERDHRHG